MNQTCCRSAVAALLLAACAFTQPGIFTREQLIKYTPEWKGERFTDGRPKVPDGVLKRMQRVTLEEAWAVIKQAAYGQIDTRWTDAIEADFTAWLRENIDRLPVPRQQVEEILKVR